ncbi:MAG: hypothetical protein AAGF12_28340 [Myxococcota bacterium]
MRGFAVLLLLVGCSDTTPTQVLVIVDAADSLRQVGDRVQITVTGPDGPESSDVSVALADPGARGWPLEISLLPLGGDATRRFQVEAILVDSANAILGTERAAGAFVADELREIQLFFDANCGGVVCGSQETCEAGSCVSACLEPGPPGGAPVRVPCPASELDSTSCDEMDFVRKSFCDGFEIPCDGELSVGCRWNSTPNPAGDFDLVQSPVYRGANSTEFRANSNQRPADAHFVTGVFGGGDAGSRYVRLYLYPPNTSPASEVSFLGLIEREENHEHGVRITVTGTGALFLEHAADGAMLAAATDPIAANEWSCIELGVVEAAGGDPTLALFVNGAPAVEVPMADVEPPGDDLSTLEVGILRSSGLQVMQPLYLDEIVADRMRIGCD